MLVDELLILPEVTAIGENCWQTVEQMIPADWAQGRTAFGGISAGMAFQAIKTRVTDGRLLRSCTTNFVGPLSLETPFITKVTCLRSGKNVSQYTGEIIQNGQVCVFVQASFGSARESKVRVENTQKHDMPAPKKATFIPRFPKVTPKFFRHFELAIIEGGMPFTHRDSSFYHGFMRFKEPPAVMTDAHLITMIDAWPSTLLQMLRWPAPASTLNWNLEFIHPHAEVSGIDWFAYQVHTRQAADGYGHTEATIWNTNNDVVALSRQTVAVFD